MESESAPARARMSPRMRLVVHAAALFVVLLACWPWLALRVPIARPAALLALVPATLYALLSGGAVATMRSLVMGVLALGGVVLVRRADLWTALAAAALGARTSGFRNDRAAVAGCRSRSARPCCSGSV